MENFLEYGTMTTCPKRNNYKIKPQKNKSEIAF